MLRRPRRRAPPPQQAIYEDFQPSTEWVQEPSNYLLLLHLPGFKKEDLSIAADKSGKMMVRGRKQVGDSRIAGFERYYDAPKDSELEKITWKLQDGFLTITIPKIAVVEEKKELIQEDTKMAVEEGKAVAALPKEIEEVKPEEGAAINEPKQELQTMKEGITVVEERKEAVSKVRDEEAATAALNKSKEKPTIKVETAMKETTEEQKEEKKENAEKERKEEENYIKDKLEFMEGKKEAEQKEVPASIGEKTIEGNKEETTHEYKSKSFKDKNEESEKAEEPEKLTNCHEGLEEKTKEKDKGKRRRLWNEEDNACWLDWIDRERFIDGVLRRVKRNRKLIAIALLAFSTGLFISHKLRKRG